MADGKIRREDLFDNDLFDAINELIAGIKRTVETVRQGKEEMSKATGFDAYSKGAKKAKEGVEQLSMEEKEYQKVLTQLEAEKAKLNVTQQKEFEQLQKLKKQRSEESKLIGAEKGSIAALRAENARLADARNKVTTATEAGRKKIQQLNQQIDKNNKTIKENSDKLTKQKINIGNYSSALSGLSPRLGAAASGVQMFGSALKALLLNPVIALIAGLAGAFKFLSDTFKRSQQFADSFRVAMTGIRAGIDVVQDRIIQFFKNLSNGFDNVIQILRLTGDAAMAAARGSFAEMEVYLSGITELRKKMGEEWITSGSSIREEMEKEMAAARQLTRDEQALRDTEIAFIETRAKLTREIERYRLVAKDENATNQERLDSLNEAIKLEDILLQKELVMAKERARISQQRVDLGESTAEELRDNAELQARVIELETESLKRQRTIQSERLGLYRRMRKEQVRLEKEAAAETIKIYQEMEDEIFRLLDEEIAGEDELLKQHWQDLADARALNAANSYEIMIESIQNEFDARTAALEAQKQQEIAYAESIGADVLAVQRKYAIAEEKMAEEKERAKLETIADFAGTAASLFSENTIAYKALSIAEATINTYLGATKALSSLPPPANFIAAAATVASGLGAVLKISGVTVPKFFKGTDSSPEGVAMVGEKGSELMIDRSGNVALSPSRPSLTYLEQGTKIIPADITRRIMSDTITANILMSKGKRSEARELIEQLSEDNRKLRDIVRKKGNTTVNIDSAGITVMTERGRTLERRIDKYIRS